MPDIDRTTIWPRLAAGIVGACTAVVLTACGGSEEAPASPATTEAAEDSAATAEAAPEGGSASGDLQGCLEEAGFTVKEGSTPAELAEGLGIEQQLRVVGPDEGVGSVTVYASLDGAEEALVAEQAAETEGVAIARMDNTVYVYSGDFDSEMAISKCVQ